MKVEGDNPFTEVVAVKFNIVLQKPSEILVRVIVVFVVTAETVTVADPPVKDIVLFPDPKL